MESSYHHGSLREALLDATESLLAERGPQGFSLREVARRAGVSPAAPAHHFGSAGGLLTAVATVAFDAFAKALRKGDARGGEDPKLRLREQGVEYVRFALRHPGRFRLMFSEVLSVEDEALQRSGNEAFLVLEHGVRRAFGIAPEAALGDAGWHALLALWSVVHGYAHLAIAGRLDPCAGGKPLDRYVERTLRPVLELVIAGSLPNPRH
jgi:AcrR family transcriptional regulator